MLPLRLGAALPAAAARRPAVLPADLVVFLVVAAICGLLSSAGSCPGVVRT